MAAAAGLALDDVNTLSSIAKSLGSNPNHLGVITLSLDRSGAVVSGGELDANADFSGYSDGSSTKIRMFVPGTESVSDDWSTQAASGLALAAYKLNSVLDQSDGQTQGANVNASA